MWNLFFNTQDDQTRIYTEDNTDRIDDQPLTGVWLYVGNALFTDSHIAKHQNVSGNFKETKNKQ